jgi:hypothetical protein
MALSASVPSLSSIYLMLESAIVALDGRGHPDAYAVRDIMDRLWCELSAEDRVALNARGNISPA